METGAQKIHIALLKNHMDIYIRFTTIPNDLRILQNLQILKAVINYNLEV
jgi:hypothetical protein